MSERKVLSTRELDPAVIAKAAEHGIQIIEIPMISIQFIYSNELIKKVNSLTNCVVVFTSKNAVNAVERILNEPVIVQSWRIYCLGGATATAAESLLGKEPEQLHAHDGKSLAEEIIRLEDPQEIHFFCGDRRRDVLPVLLSNAGFDVKEEVVYNTVSTPVEITEVFEEILFYSPSAVQSFFQANQISHNATCYSIGNTTTEELSKHTRNKIITATEPTEPAMLTMLIDSRN